MEKNKEFGEKEKKLIIHERVQVGYEKFACICELNLEFSHDGYSKHLGRNYHSNRSSREKAKIMNSGQVSQGISDLKLIRKDHVKEKDAKSESSIKRKIQKLLRIRLLKKPRKKNQGKTSKESSRTIKVEPVDKPANVKIPGNPCSTYSCTSSTATTIKNKSPRVVLKDFMKEPEKNCDPMAIKFRKKHIHKILMRNNPENFDGDDNPEQSVETTSYEVQEMPETLDIDMFQSSKRKLKTKEKQKQVDCKEFNSESVSVTSVSETTKSHYSLFGQNDDEKKRKFCAQGMADLEQEIKETETEVGDEEKKLSESLERAENREEKYQYLDDEICQKIPETKLKEEMAESTGVRKDLKTIKDNLKVKIPNEDEPGQKVQLMNVSLQNIKEKLSQSIQQTLSKKRTLLAKQDFTNGQIREMENSGCNLTEEGFKKPVAPSQNQPSTTSFKKPVAPSQSQPSRTSSKKQAPCDEPEEPFAKKQRSSPGPSPWNNDD